MGEWHEVKGTLYKRDDSPCSGCQVGSCDVFQKYENDKFYEKFDYCQETCKRYLEYTENPERFFGQNIRDAIRAIKD